MKDKIKIDCFGNNDKSKIHWITKKEVDVE